VNALARATADGFQVGTKPDALGCYNFKRVHTTLRGVELWSAAMRSAATFEPDYIYWKGWPELDQAIRDYVNAGGKL
jgi:hypothetical protein